MAGPSVGDPPRRTLRVPPQNLIAEESLLGAMLLSRDAIAAASDVVRADHFYKPAHAHIFDAIASLYGVGEPIDAITVSEELRRAGLLDAIGGPGTLVSLQAGAPAISNARRHAEIVEELALLRSMIGAAGEIAELGYSLPDDVAKAVDQAEAMIFALAEHRTTTSTSSVHELLGATLDRLEQLYERGESITGTPTGYLDLDEVLAGLQPDNLVVVGARPAMGKALALDTPIPTPSGWSTMGGLAVGDAVLDEAGRPCTVLAATDVQQERRCFEVVFDDGSVIVADAEHRWWVHDRVELAEGMVVRTTAELLAEGLRQGDRPRWHVPVARSLQLPAACLPVAPRCVGRRQGVHGRVPPAYLRGSQRQRLELWRGFLDAALVTSNGVGQHTMCLPSCELACDVAELLCALGAPARFVSNSRGQPMVTWREPGDSGEPGGLDPRAGCSRTIVHIAPAASVPVRCISVDSPSQVYLAGLGMIPTHNTAFALGLAAHSALSAHKPSLIFSLEMSRLEITQRLLSSEAQVDASRMRTGKLTEADWEKIGRAVGPLAEAPIWIDDNPNVTVMEIRSKARKLKSQVGELGVVVVDYVQLMTGRTSAESRQVEVAEISRGLKILAREIKAPVVALAQLNRSLEQRADKRPMLSDLRESGSLEQDADVVVFLYRDEVYNRDSADLGVAEVIVAKHRSGPTATVRLAFLGKFTKFANMARTP